VTVTSLQVETIKVGTGKKAKKETVLVLDFSGALNAVVADNTDAYPLARIIKVWPPSSAPRAASQRPPHPPYGHLLPAGRRGAVTAADRG
jgi:hypothetical protein